MSDPYLESITIHLQNEGGIVDDLISLFGKIGIRQRELFEFHRSDPGFYPRLFLGAENGVGDARIEFCLSNGQHHSVRVENTTGIEKKSPHEYGFVALEEVNSRLDAEGLSIVDVDHLGFNLPWFEPGLHPQIAGLRSLLTPACLYHHFPSGEAWDFILPGDCEEIFSRKPVDYSHLRRPKFELVSFEKASKPLIQMEVITPARFEKLAELFPESLQDPQIGNVWVYLRNGLTIDVCLVLNPASDEDWSGYFKGCRL